VLRTSMPPRFILGMVSSIVASSGFGPPSEPCCNMPPGDQRESRALKKIVDHGVPEPHTLDERLLELLPLPSVREIS